MLKLAKIDRTECYVGNVFRVQPPENDATWFFDPKKKDSPYPRIDKIGCVKDEWLPHIELLKKDLETLKPNITIALGNYAMWALTGNFKITKFRGTLLNSTLVSGLKVMATYHPAGVLRQWPWRPTVWQDLKKAKEQSEFPEIRIKNRKVWLFPSQEDLDKFEKEYINGCERLAFDIETDRVSKITAISFAPNDTVSICILDPCSNHRDWVHRILSSGIPKLAHNGLYDIQWLRSKGFEVNGAYDDTMFMAHAIQPELPKSLGYLLSVCVADLPWKEINPNKSGKKEDSE